MRIASISCLSITDNYNYDVTYLVALQSQKEDVHEKDSKNQGDRGRRSRQEASISNRTLCELSHLTWMPKILLDPPIYLKLTSLGDYFS